MKRWSCPNGTWETVFSRAHPRLRSRVLGYRGFRVDLGRPQQRLEVPAGAVTLVLLMDGELQVTDGVGRTGATRRFTSLLAGLQTRARIGEHRGTLRGMEIVLTPWAAFEMFDTHMYEVANTLVPPADVLGVRTSDLTEALSVLRTWPERFALLDTVLVQWTGKGHVCPPQVVWAWNELNRTGGMIPIRRLAAETGWSWRQLENRFRTHIGLTPKAAARVLRLRRTLRLLVDRLAPADVAAICGFTDQAHLAREFKAMVGRPPRKFLSERIIAPPDQVAADRVAGNVTSVVLPRA